MFTRHNDVLTLQNPSLKTTIKKKKKKEEEEKNKKRFCFDLVSLFETQEDTAPQIYITS
jgi:hypothetical protein